MEDLHPNRPLSRASLDIGFNQVNGQARHSRKKNYLLIIDLSSN